MRNTFALDPDVDILVRKLMKERGISFERAVNHAIRSALTPETPRDPYSTPTRDMGIPLVPLQKALERADALER